jgi:hypothetical protein
MSAKIGVGLTAALLLLYLLLTAGRSLELIVSGEPVAIVIGLASLGLPILGMWALGRELLFGIASQRLIARMAAEDSLPVEELPLRPSGRPERAAADADFPRWAEAVDQNPDSWRDWMRLGFAYDASGDRRRARSAIRTAIRLERQGPPR